MLTARGGGGRLIVATLVSMSLFAACAADGDRTSAPASDPSTPEATTAAAETTPLATPAAAPTLSAEPPIPASEEPAEAPADVARTADACSGSADNRSFFGLAAESLPWQVYCALLPDGWLVQSGSYRLGDGGSLRVAYAGPGGTRFELREGAICADDSSCVPSGDDLGVVPFGDREARLLTWDDGYAAMVDGGAPVSWVAYGTGLDETTFRALVAGLIPVAPAP